MSATTFARHGLVGLILCSGVLLSTTGCPPPDTTTDPNDAPKAIAWRLAFQASGLGALSGVWGSSTSNVFIVGGDDTQGEVYRFNGSGWEGMTTPEVPLLVWVFGFGPDDVWAVGVGGGVLHYDGTAWTRLDAGTTEDLWGVWGSAPNDIWIVGGNTGVGEPVILHYDGSTFTPFDVPANDRNATSLFKVWGIGGKVFAVGEQGLIIEWNGANWAQVPAGASANEDFVSLWGTSENNIVAVGGRTSARIATYDGTSWTTIAPGTAPGLNAVFMTAENQAVVGGQNGYVGVFDPQTGELTDESSGASLDVHALFGFDSVQFGVGGRFSPPYAGLALVRDDQDLAPAVAPVPGQVIEDTTTTPAPEVDCNDNDTEDADEIAAGTAEDCDGNGVPDECDPDTDGDGIPDGCDACPAGDDAIDTDKDGVADACDQCVGGDDAIDTDKDGVADACDICPGSDDRDDADGDGVPDGCDKCPGADDDIDSDGDGVADGCDICPAGDDNIDTDGDGTPNACDDCVGDDLADADNDGVADDCDVCPGHDDNQDSDNDGVADGCDICPGSSDTADADGDGVIDCQDICPGHDDAVDTDGDGVPNGCDVCPGGDDDVDTDGDGNPDFCDACPLDANDDSDGDGVCDTADQCPGGDDNVDRDGDGIPDDCDCFNSDCPIGQDCLNGTCQPAVGNDVEIGFVDEGDPNAPFTVRDDFADLKIFRGFQSAALYDFWISGRVTGLNPDAQVFVEVNLYLLSDPTTDIGNGLWLTRLEPDPQSGVQQFPAIEILAAVQFVPQVPLPLCDAPARMEIIVEDAITGDMATGEIYVTLRPEPYATLCP